jgi:serine/threonine protein kinase
LSTHDDPLQVTTGVREGDVIAGKYRVEKILGSGGMGVVVAARHVQLDDKVALKFLRPVAVEKPEAAIRFLREARAAVKIKSEHVARVTDVGTMENGAPYMVMEYLEGSDLAGWLKERGSLPVEQAVGFLLQACEALAEAHALGIVHRDLKPANLFLTKRPAGAAIVKVLDFGISKSVLPTADADLTNTAAFLGSPLYMSPEQMQSSKSVDARSDIWALGIVLYELVTGTTPFQRDTFTEVVTAVLQHEPAPFRPTSPEIPLAFEAVVGRCIAKDPAARFPNVAELAAALTPFGPPGSEASAQRIAQALGVGTPTPPLPASGNAVVSPSRRDVGVAVGATTSKPVAQDTPSIPELASRRKRRLSGPVAGLLVVSSVGAAFGVWWSTSTRKTPASPAITAEPSASHGSAEPPPMPSSSAAPSATATVAVAASQPTPPPAAGSLVSAPQPLPHRPPAPRGSSPAPATSTATPKPNCNPPYTIDAVGHHQYKPECN